MLSGKAIATENQGLISNSTDASQGCSRLRENGKENRIVAAQRTNAEVLLPTEVNLSFKNLVMQSTYLDFYGQVYWLLLFFFQLINYSNNWSTTE